MHQIGSDTEVNKKVKIEFIYHYEAVKVTHCVYFDVIYIKISILTYFFISILPNFNIEKTVWIIVIYTVTCSNYIIDYES